MGERHPRSESGWRGGERPGYRRNGLLVNQLTRGEIRQLLSGRLAAEYGIAVGMAGEARDQVAMTAGPAGGEFVDLAQVIGRLVEQRFGETDAALLQVEPLRVSEREKEERPFPDGPEP